MATRNRTNLYISYRQSYAHHPTQSYSTYNPSSTEELDTLISNRADAAIEMDILPPAWADKTQEVDEILQNIAKMSAKLDKLHARHVLPGFDDKREEEGEIERLTFEITNVRRQDILLMVLKCVWCSCILMG
jgi:syntaxin 16